MHEGCFHRKKKTMSEILIRVNSFALIGVKEVTSQTRLTQPTHYFLMSKLVAPRPL